MQLDDTPKLNEEKSIEFNKMQIDIKFQLA